MKSLTKTKHWTLFMITVLPFLLGRASGYHHIFFALGFFLYMYWIISAGKYGSLLFEKQVKGILWFSLMNRLIFILFAVIYYLLYFKGFPPQAPLYTILLYGSIVLFLSAYFYTVIFSSLILERLENEKPVLISIFTNCYLFILFPIGVWILQPRVNELIGKRLEDED
jgi:hypothetical protein